MVSNFLNNQLLEQYLNRNFAQPVDTGMPVQNKLYEQPYNMFDIAGGITSIPTNMSTQNFEDEDEDELSYSGIGNMTYGTPRTIADQNAILGRTFTQQPTGIAKLFEMFGNIPTPFNLARKALGGIFGGLKGLNTKIQGTTFALSPTLKDYFAAKRMEKIAEKGADVGIGPGGTGSRRGDADIAGKDRGSFKTDDTAGFF